MAPAIQLSRSDVITALKDETSHGYLKKSRLRSGLVVVQIGVSLSLLIGAGLLAVNVYRLQHADTGMNSRNVFSIAAGVSRRDRQVTEGEETRKKETLADQLRLLPDVTSVSEAFNQPLSGQMEIAC
jgi:hypothetical protein